MRNRAHQTNRRGLTVMEATVALVILASAIAVGARTMATSAVQRRAAAQRSAAALEAANVLERVMAGDFDTLAEGNEKPALSDSAAKILPAAELKILVDEPQTVEGADALEARRVTVELRWKNSAGLWAAPVRLSAWRHRARPENGPSEAAP
jgi:hypothetical protein